MSIFAHVCVCVSVASLTQGRWGWPAGVRPPSQHCTPAGHVPGGEHPGRSPPPPPPLPSSQLQPPQGRETPALRERERESERAREREREREDGRKFNMYDRDRDLHFENNVC